MEKHEHSTDDVGTWRLDTQNRCRFLIARSWKHMDSSDYPSIKPIDWFIETGRTDSIVKEKKSSYIFEEQKLYKSKHIVLPLCHTDRIFSSQLFYCQLSAKIKRQSYQLNQKCPWKQRKDTGLPWLWKKPGRVKSWFSRDFLWKSKRTCWAPEWSEGNE